MFSRFITCFKVSAKEEANNKEVDGGVIAEGVIAEGVIAVVVKKPVWIYLLRPDGYIQMMKQ